MAEKLSEAAATFLRQVETTDPSLLFREYGRFLLQSANAWTLPVPLQQVRKRYGVHKETATHIGRRGFLFGDTIFVNEDDLDTVQRFTEAHEFMESLYVALKRERPARFSSTVWQKFDEKKEAFCEEGAAELLMPAELFFPLVQNFGISLTSARTLSSRCHTSLTATVRRMLDTDLTASIFALLKKGYKKAQHVPSQVGQSVLWGDPEDWDPPAELRVWKRWVSPQTTPFLCWNESIERDTIIYETLQSGVSGVIRSGMDSLNLEYIKGQYPTESMLVVIDDTSVVMTLIHLSNKETSV